jgi:predicted nucleic acid-binding protein
METAAARDLFTEVASQDIDAGIAELGSQIARGHPGIFSTDRATADALIAGTAYAQNATLVTLNTRQVSRLRIPGLNLLVIDQQAADWVPASP